MLAEKVLFLRKPSAELVLTNLKTFGLLSFVTIKKWNAVIMNRRKRQKFLTLLSVKLDPLLTRLKAMSLSLSH